jgi:hypothetical protein
MAHPIRVPVVTLALFVLIPGCDDGDRASTPSAGPTIPSACELGEPPGYFVPGPDADDPLAIIGCARLGPSGKPIEFTAHAEQIVREAHICVNAAYRGRGQLGIYIPSVCPLNPVPRGVRVLSARIPRQAVRRYELVIWGTTGASTRHVVARHHLGATAAAVFRVNRQLARAVGAKRLFSVFVVELAPEAGCQAIRVDAQGRSGSTTQRIRPHPNLCKAT